MMTAKDANALAKTKNEELDYVMEKISEAVERSEVRIWWWKDLSSRTTESLESMGYVIGYDKQEVGDAVCVIKWDDESLGL